MGNWWTRNAQACAPRLWEAQPKQAICRKRKLSIDQECVLDNDVYIYICDNDTMQITRLEITESTTRGSYDGWHYIE